LFVTSEFLRRRFEILRALNYTVLPLAEATTRLANGTLPPRSVALTFDDGFYNFHAAAAPILKQFELPATVYLSTYHCVNQRPILGLTVPYLLWRARAQPNDLGDLRQIDRRSAVATSLLTEARLLSADRSAQLQWLQALAEKLRVDWSVFMKSRVMHLMTPEEVSAVAALGIDVQLHTHRHRTPQDKSLFVSEVLENQRLIGDMTGNVATHFCYPSGVVHANFLHWLRELGVQTATTCQTGLAASRADSLLLPRFIDTMGQTELSFEGWLSGASNWLSKGHKIEV
jgi:peptidoglycan/xylan/chitin deacetylase (PgdA/CDA1 family)